MTAVGLAVVPPWIVLKRLPHCSTNVLLTIGEPTGRVPSSLTSPRNVSENSHSTRPPGSFTE